MFAPPLRSLLVVAALIGLAGPRALSAQQAAPLGESALATSLRTQGERMLDAEDPTEAWRAFRAARDAGAMPVESGLGLGRAHLMLGNSPFALAYAESALLDQPTSQEAMALCVRALIRARRFDEAVQRAGSFVARAGMPVGELLAARGSALFRVQRIDEAALAYTSTLAVEPMHAEAHLRLGSGLLAPARLTVPDELVAAVDAVLRGDRPRAIELLVATLRDHRDHAIAHRLLGEVLFAQRTALCMASNDAAYAALAAAIPRPRTSALPIGQFVPGYERLSPARAAVVARTMAMFGSQLGKLIAIGGRHDLLAELERTTDAETRSGLRGRRTFDGRVWDDVRGVGGLQAATGIEALDDAVAFGFDTFAHEVAHQVHYHALPRVQRVRITALYQRAMAEGRCLDFYAASNEAEYFGQGVEAFVSLCKRPGGEATHGHTRFELFAVDRDLHDFIAGLVDFDPLARADTRERVLEAAVAVALRCGRPRDAEVAAAMLPPGELRTALAARAGAALARDRCH